MGCGSAPKRFPTPPRRLHLSPPAGEGVGLALYEGWNVLALAVCLGLTLLFSLLAVVTFNPQHAALRRAGG